MADGSYLTCTPTIYGVNIVSFIVIIFGLIWSIDRIHQTRLPLYFGTFLLCFCHTLVVSFQLGGCITRNGNVFDVANLMGFAELALLETLVVYRFKVFRSLVLIPDIYLYTIVILFWIISIVTTAFLGLNDQETVGKIAPAVAPLLLLIEIPTAYYSLKVVLNSYKSKATNSSELRKYSRLASIGFGLYMICWVGAIIAALSTQVLNIGTEQDGIALLIFSVLGLGISSFITYESIVQIFILKHKNSKEGQGQRFSTVASNIVAGDTI